MVHILVNNKTNKAEAYKYATPDLNNIIGYSERKMQRIIREGEVITEGNYTLYPNSYYSKGARGGKREPKSREEY